MNSLEPSYSLAILGPFSKSTINLPAYFLDGRFDTKVSLVNTGAADARLSINRYGVDGTALPSSPVAMTVGANRQMFGSVGSLGFSTAGLGRTGWVQAPADGKTVPGIVTVGNGTLFEALPMSTGRSSSSVVTGIEFDDVNSTEIHVVNPAAHPRILTINLYSSEGNQVGEYATRLDPKSTLVNRIEGLFPSIKPPFTGYAVVSGDGDVLASTLLYSYASLSAMSGHPVNPQAAATTLYGAQLGAPGQFTRVILVNAGTSAANLTLTPYKPDGSSAGRPVSMTLPPGRQFVSDLAQLFGFDPDNPQAGSFTVKTDQPSVYGDLTFGDSSVMQSTRASVPLLDAREFTHVVKRVERAKHGNQSAHRQ